MTGEIEKMSRMRRNILFGVLMGSVIAFTWFMQPYLIHIARRFRFRLSAFWGAVILWLLTVFIFVVRYWIYKRKLWKKPSLRAAVNDERIRRNWLKAYRFAFYITVIVTVVWKLYEMCYADVLLRGAMSLPPGPLFVLFCAIISLVGSFLFYNREVIDG